MAKPHFVLIAHPKSEIQECFLSKQDKTIFSEGKQIFNMENEGFCI